MTCHVWHLDNGLIFTPVQCTGVIFSFLFFSCILSVYGEKYQTLHDSQEGFRAERWTSRELQVLIVALEDARFTNQDIYILYIDFKNVFGSIDHARLLTIMKDLGYPNDVIKLIRNIYSQFTTIFIGVHFGKTQFIQFKEEQYKEIP